MSGEPVQTGAKTAPRGQSAVQVVPSTGVSTSLIVLVAAAMCFLAALSLAFSFSAQRLGSVWEQGVRGTATVTLSSSGDLLDQQTEAVLRVLRTTPGIDTARIVEDDEQIALLEPWLGQAGFADGLDLPRLIAVEEDGTGPDYENLRLRLAGEVPDVLFDDHAVWQAPVLSAAARINWLGFAAVILVLGTLVAVIALAAQAGVAMNAKVIRTLRLMGARDIFIMRAFMHRFSLLAAVGGAIGIGGAALVIGLGDGRIDRVLQTRFGFEGGEWIALLVLLLLAVLITYFTTRLTCRILLRRIP